MGAITAALMVFTVWCHEQVSDVFHVDFKETNSYTKDGLIWILLNVVEDVLNGTRNNTKLVLCPGHFLII